jgi:hypothetical protein
LIQLEDVMGNLTVRLCRFVNITYASVASGSVIGSESDGQLTIIRLIDC